MSTFESHYRDYPSSLDPELVLWGRFTPFSKPAPLLLHMHGWHGNVKFGHDDNLAPPAHAACFRVQPEMRGRGDSSGRPDANGRELMDAVDALDAARALWPEWVCPATGPHLHGGSGGGGNVFAMVGKFPDLFASAIAECGISDYGVWFEGDDAGEFRDEMQDEGWIGGTPADNPEGYLSRGGRTTARNLLTPLLVVHGEGDLRVPVHQSRLYLDAARAAGRGDLVESLIFEGVGGRAHLEFLTAEQDSQRQSKTASHRENHTRPPTIPRSGTFVVAGYLVTKFFRVFLEETGQVALLDYDLAEKNFSLRAPSCRTAQIILEPEGGTVSLQCTPISLKEFCREI